MSEELVIKMDHDPEKPTTMEQEITIARRNANRSGDGTMTLAYWTGMLDGLETAFNLMREKDG